MSLPAYTALNDAGANSDQPGRDVRFYTDFSQDIDLTSVSSGAQGGSPLGRVPRFVVPLAAGAGATLNLVAGQAVARSAPADLLVKFAVPFPVFGILASGTSGVTSVMVVW